MPREPSEADNHSQPGMSTRWSGCDNLTWGCGASKKYLGTARPDTSRSLLIVPDFALHLHASPRHPVHSAGRRTLVIATAWRVKLYSRPPRTTTGTGIHLVYPAHESSTPAEHHKHKSSANPTNNHTHYLHNKSYKSSETIRETLWKQATTHAGWTNRLSGPFCVPRKW